MAPRRMVSVSVDVVFVSLVDRLFRVCAYSLRARPYDLSVLMPNQIQL